MLQLLFGMINLQKYNKLFKLGVYRIWNITWILGSTPTIIAFTTTSLFGWSSSLERFGHIVSFFKTVLQTLHTQILYFSKIHFKWLPFLKQTLLGDFSPKHVSAKFLQPKLLVPITVTQIDTQSNIGFHHPKVRGYRTRSSN